MNGTDKLKQDIAENTFGRLYFIFGEEDYLKEHYKSQLLRAFGGTFSDFNLMVLDGDATYEEILVFCDALPMMSDRKLLIINNLNILKLTGDLRDKLADLISDIPEYVTVAFTYSGAEFKPDKRIKLWQVIEKIGCVCQVDRASKTDLVAWIKRRMKALEHTIATPECEYLMFLCGDLMTNLVGECEKIASGTKNPAIEKRHIDALASRTLEAQVFDLTGKIAQRDYASAFEKLNELLLLKNEPVVLCGVIAKHIGRMYGAKLGIAKNYSDSDIMKLCGFKSMYPVTIMCRDVRGCSIEWLRKAVKLCYDTDLKIKSNVPDDNRKLELLLCRLAKAEA